MIPRAHQGLNDLAGRIGARIMPELGNPYAITESGLISLLLTMLSEELESGVARRMEDGEALRALFRTATDAPDPEPRAAFIASHPSTLTLTDVTTWLDQGLALLIELHAWAEVSDEALNARIWEFLTTHTERHKFDL